MAIKALKSSQTASTSPRPSLESSRTAPDLRNPSPPPAIPPRALSSRFSSESLKTSPMTWISSARERIKHVKASSITTPSSPAVIEISNPVLVVPVSPRISTVSVTLERRNDSLGRGAQPVDRLQGVRRPASPRPNRDSIMETLAPSPPPRRRPRSQSLGGAPVRPERSLPAPPSMVLSASTSALPDEPPSPIDRIAMPVIKAFHAAQITSDAHSPTAESPILASFQTAVIAPRSSGQASVYPPTPSSATGPSPVAFRALLAAPLPLWPAALANEAKRVDLDVGGQRFSTSLATLSRHPSHLADFARHVLGRPSSTLVPPRPLLAATAQRKPSELPALGAAPHIIDAPLAPPRSARAEVLSFPSAETGAPVTGDGIEDWSADYLLHPLPSSTSSSPAPEMRFRRVRTPSLSSASSTSADDDDDDVSAAAMPADPYATLAIFLDRDPAAYVAVLHYLRTGDLLSPRCGLVVDDVEAEAKWLGLEALAELCASRRASAASLGRSIRPGMAASVQASKDRKDWI